MSIILVIICDKNSHIYFSFPTTGNYVSPHLQALVAFRYLATGNHQLTIAGCADMSQTFLSTCVTRAIMALAALWVEWIKMPSGNKVNAVIQACYACCYRLNHSGTKKAECSGSLLAPVTVLQHCFMMVWEY